MKVALASTSLLALPTYKALKRSKHDFLALITKTEVRAGRGMRVSENELVKAIGQDEEIVRISGNKDLLSALNSLEPDLVIAISFGLLVKPASLQIPKHGWINLHFSLLPKYRGAAPVARAILSGESSSGITVFKLDEGMDSGPIYRAKELSLGEKSNGDLLIEFAEQGSKEVLETIEMIDKGILPKTQVGSVSLAPKIESGELRLNLHMDSTEILRKIRAFSPKPGAWCELNGARIKILSARATNSIPGNAGEITSLTPFIVSCGAGAIEITRLQEAGKQAMSAADWARGSRVSVGRFLV